MVYNQMQKREFQKQLEKKLQTKVFFLNLSKQVLEDEEKKSNELSIMW